MAISHRSQKDSMDLRYDMCGLAPRTLCATLSLNLSSRVRGYFYLPRAASLGVSGKLDIPYFTPSAQMRFPLYPAARVPRRRCTLYPVPGYGGELLIAF